MLVLRHPTVIVYVIVIISDRFVKRELPMSLYVATLLDLHDAMYRYYHWVSERQHVHAVDIRHKCAYRSEFQLVRMNQHSIMKVILFDHNSYYGVKLMDRTFFEEIGSLLMFYCPCCLEEFWTPPTY